MDLEETQGQWMQFADRQSIRKLRSEKREWPPESPAGICLQQEATVDRKSVWVGTIFLVGAECSFTCSMCDLWKYTLAGPTVEGHIPKQIESVLNELETCQWIKLYNASNFFDPRSVPVEDLPRIAELCSRFDRVIVENHPRMSRWREIDTFVENLKSKLEIAMGLETVHPTALRILNKEMSVSDFERTANLLNDRRIDVRAFLLSHVPGIEKGAALEWCLKSVDFAARCGLRHISLIPTRAGNGWMDQLIARGQFSLPTALEMEELMVEALRWSEKSVVSLDTWDWHLLAGHCNICRDLRLKRMESVNILQKWIPLEKLPECSCATLT